jgi:15-cis-phytoene desaturase
VIREQSSTVHADQYADVVIVGGGLAGIACAIGLRGSGLKVVLLEETGSLGGRARSWVDRKSGDVIDIGPHLLLSEHTNLLALLEQLGTAGHIVWERERRAHGTSLRDKLSNRAVLWLAMQIREEDVLRLDDMSAAELLHRYHVAPRLIEWFWASVSMSMLNVPLEQCSAGALMRVYAQFVSHRRHRVGFADCGLGDLYVPAALRSIMDAGGRVHLRTRVVALILQNGKAAGVLLEDGTRINAPHCVMAMPPHSLVRLLPARCRAQRPFCDTRAFEASPQVSMYLWLDRKLAPDRYWARAACGTQLNNEFYDLSNIRTGWGGRASVIASNIIHSHRADNLSDEELIAVTLNELADVVPGATRVRVLHSVVNRIPMAVPCPAPGTEQKRPDAATSIPGLMLAGDWTRTQLPACMESAVRSGWLAAEGILGAVGQPRQLARPVPPPEGIAGLVHRLLPRSRRELRVPVHRPVALGAQLRLNEAAGPDQTTR